MLIGRGVAFSNTSTKLTFDSVQQRGIFWLWLPVPLWLARFSSQFFDRLNRRLEFHVSEQHRAQHLVFGQFFRFGFNHQHGIFCTGDNHVQTRAFKLLVIRVEYITLFIIKGDTGATDGAVERRTGNSQRSRRTEHGGHVGVSCLVGRHYGTNDLNFVHEAICKQRTDRAIDQT